MSVIGTIAEAIYEACRQEAVDSDRPIVPELWTERDESFRAQFVTTIERICQPGYETTPEQEHDSWMLAYKAMGWQYGEVRDPIAKTHPDMVPFSELPESERQKDAIFLACCAVGRAVLTYISQLEAQLKDAEEVSTLKGLMAGQLLLLLKEVYQRLSGGDVEATLHFIKDALADVDIDVEEPPQYGEVEQVDEVAYTEMMGHRQAMYLARISTLEAQLKDAEKVIKGLMQLLKALDRTPLGRAKEVGKATLPLEYYLANYGEVE